MTLSRFAVVIASLSLAITSLQISAETEVAADFQDAVVEESVVENAAKTINRGNAPNGGVIILNTNSNDNKNDSAANAESVSVADMASEVVVENEALSQADSMRNARKSAEMSTEQRIVEKLEASRLDDERRRADVLFGDRFDSLEKKKVIKKTLVEDSEYGYDDEVIEKKVIIKKVEVEKAQEPVVVAPVQTQVVAIQAPQHHHQERTYMGLTLGGMSYDANNVESNYAIGAVIGRDLGNNAVVEGSFLYSNHFLDKGHGFWLTPLYSEVSQYDFGFAAKYVIFKGTIKPFVGAGVNYIYRNYQDRISYGPYGSEQFGEEANTHAVDGSLMAGLDIEISKNLLIGAEFKYSSNVFVKNDEPVFAQSWARPLNGKPLEEIDRSQVTVNAKFLF